MNTTKRKLSFFILLFFLFLLYLTFIIKYPIFFSNNRYFHNHYLFKPNSNKIKVEERIYFNKSFGLNHLDKCQNQFLMKFNRKSPNFYSNILVTLILMYPDPFSIIKSTLVDYIDILSSNIDFNFSLAIITYNNDISDLMIKNNVFLKYISNFTLRNIEIPNSEYFSFVIHSRNKIIDLFYTDTKKSKYTNFEIDFLNESHYTSVFRHKFTGWYAAGTNYYAYVLSHLGIFDFFDFFIKFDPDLITRLKNKPNLQPFPLKKMIKNNQYFFFGCEKFNDSYFVSTNLYKVFFLYLLEQSEKCKYTFLPTNLYKYNESLCSFGVFNIGWLGFYSMLNIRYFSEKYISSPDGLYENRWGDQQFFIPTLFGFNFYNYSYFSKNTFLCSYS